MAQCYPDLMFVGESKCGSTSIAAYMLAHPQVILQTKDHGLSGWEVNSSVPISVQDLGDKKVSWEAHVFDKHRASNSMLEVENWNTVPLVPAGEVGNYLQMHYTPNYIYYPDTPFHILDLYPNARSIKYFAILREPVERAVSSWKFHHVTAEVRSFDKAVNAGISQRRALEACYAKSLKTEADSSAAFVEDLPVEKQRSVVNKCFWGTPGTHDETLPPETWITLMHAHVDKGIYVDQLRRWFSLLGRENFFVFSLEEWIKDPQGIYMQLSDFAGYEAIGPNGFRDAEAMAEVLSHQYNDGAGLPEVKVPEPSDEMREKLRKFYEPYNEALFELLGRRLWNTTRK